MTTQIDGHFTGVGLLVDGDVVSGVRQRRADGCLVVGQAPSEQEAVT